MNENPKPADVSEDRKPKCVRCDAKPLPFASMRPLCGRCEAMLEKELRESERPPDEIIANNPGKSFSQLTYFPGIVDGKFTGWKWFRRNFTNRQFYRLIDTVTGETVHLNRIDAVQPYESNKTLDGRIVGQTSRTCIIEVFDAYVPVSHKIEGENDETDPSEKFTAVVVDESSVMPAPNVDNLSVGDVVTLRRELLREVDASINRFLEAIEAHVDGDPAETRVDK